MNRIWFLAYTVLGGVAAILGMLLGLGSVLLTWPALIPGFVIGSVFFLLSKIIQKIGFISLSVCGVVLFLSSLLFWVAMVGI